jgi:hypothetical protein
VPSSSLLVCEVWAPTLRTECQLLPVVRDMASADDLVVGEGVCVRCRWEVL